MFKKAERKRRRERDHHDLVFGENQCHTPFKNFLIIIIIIILNNCNLQKQAKDSEQVQHAIKTRSRLEIISYKTLYTVCSSRTR